MQQVQDTLPIGSSISGGSRDRYIVEAILGKGGFGTIYLVRDQRVRQNLYALKEVIDPNKHELEHLSFECEILRHIEHPSLPRLQRVFEDTKRNRVAVGVQSSVAWCPDCHNRPLLSLIENLFSLWLRQV